jgi:hypothetical protein
VTERQLQSRGMATEVEVVANYAESEHNNKEIDSNVSEIEVHMGGEDEQSSNNQVNNSEKSDGNFAIFARQIEKFMESVIEGFENFQTKIHNDNRRLVEQIESNNVRLSLTLTKQFREENEKLRTELSSKLEREVTKFQKDMDKLHSNTAIELLSVSSSMEGVCEKLDDRLTGHIEETDRRINRVTEELNAKTKVLEINLSQHVENTDSDVQSIKQELLQAKQQTNVDVSDKISVCNNQILAEKQEYQAKFLKVDQEINKLKEKLSVNMIGDKAISNHNNGCPIIALVNGSQEGAVSVASTSNQASDKRSINVNRACESVL